MHLHVEVQRQLTDGMAEVVAEVGDGACLRSVLLFGSSLWSEGGDVDVLAVLDAPSGWTPQRNVKVAASIRRLRCGSRPVDPFVRSSAQLSRARHVAGTLEHLVTSHGIVIHGEPPPPLAISDVERSRIAEASAQAWLATASRNLIEQPSTDRWRGRRGAEKAIAMAFACLLRIDPPEPASSDAAWSLFLSDSRVALKSLEDEAPHRASSANSRLLRASLVSFVDAHFRGDLSHAP